MWGTGAKSRSSNGRGSCAPSRGRSRTSPPSSGCRSRACRCGCATSNSSRTLGGARTGRGPTRIRCTSPSSTRSSDATARAPNGSACCPNVSSSCSAPRSTPGRAAKTQDTLAFANSDPRLIRIFVTWLRRFFDIDESKLRVRLYLHEGLDLDAATAFWSDVTEIPPSQFYKPYRAPADGTIRTNEAPDGLSGGQLLVDLVVPPCHGSRRGGIVSSCNSGVAQLAERRPVKPFVVGSSPTPGANATTWWSRPDAGRRAHLPRAPSASLPA